VEEYYSLGEYSMEEQLKEYVATWFSEETFDYLMNMCFIMYGVVRAEDGKYMLMRGLALPMDQYVVDDFSSIVIKEYTDVECTVSVPFQDLNGWPEDMSTYSEGEMVLRQEGNRWIITEISEPHYDEFWQWGQSYVEG
ncbi:MAG: hypothetical protein K2O15_14595, partial [Lachnospiraceae bacterium]|nr:hypothetical protein [Lachnospiraceae bacterium]